MEFERDKWNHGQIGRMICLCMYHSADLGICDPHDLVTRKHWLLLFFHDLFPSESLENFGGGKKGE